jgi:hypothetical protein
MAKRPSRRKPDNRGTRGVRIQLGPDEHRVIDEVVAALARGKTPLYQRHGRLVRVIQPAGTPGDTHPPPPQIDPVPLGDLRTRITEVADLRARGSTGRWRSVSPPPHLVVGVDARGNYPGIPSLRAISHAPILRPDGSVHQRAGYDPESGVLYVPPEDPCLIPDNPSREDARRAAAELLAPVRSLPFQDEADRAGWLAVVLTGAGRFAYRGPAPLFLFVGNRSGVGKDETARAAITIATGHPPQTGYYATRQFRGRCEDDPEELRKTFTAVALHGTAAYLFTNLPSNYEFGCDVLDGVLTSTEWNARLLGTNRVTTLPMHTIWLASGNNVRPNPKTDTARRVLTIRLWADDHRPWEVGYDGPPLQVRVLAERNRLLAAALTVLAAYLRAGRPPQPITHMGSYEGWSDLIRSAIVWVGLPDPVVKRTGPAEPTPPADGLCLLLDLLDEVMPEGEPLLASEILDRLTTAGLLNRWPQAKPNAWRVGLLLGRHKGLESKGRSITGSRDRNGLTLWTVRGAKGVDTR